MPPELGLRDRERGERRRRVPGELDVVAADDRDVVGHGHAGLVEPGQQPEGDEVVEGDHGRRARREDLLDDGVPVPDGRSALEDREVDLRVHEARLGEPREPPGVGGRAGRPGEVDEPRVAERDEVVDHGAHAADVVDGHARSLPLRGRAVDEDCGADLREQLGEDVVGHPRRHEHEGVAALTGLEGDLGLVVGGLAGVGDQHPVALRGCGARDSAEDLLEHRVAEVGDHQGDRVGPAQGQRARDVAGPVAQAGRGGLDALRDVGGDGRPAVHHA